MKHCWACISADKHSPLQAQLQAQGFFLQFTFCFQTNLWLMGTKLTDTILEPHLVTGALGEDQSECPPDSQLLEVSQSSDMRTFQKVSMLNPLCIPGLSIELIFPDSGPSVEQSSSLKLLMTLTIYTPFEQCFLLGLQRLRHLIFCGLQKIILGASLRRKRKRDAWSTLYYNSSSYFPQRPFAKYYMGCKLI